MKFVLIALLFVSFPAFAGNMTSIGNSQMNKLQFAQNSQAACSQLCANATTCKKRQKLMGGGTDGQAGAFYECWRAYCGGVNQIEGCSCGAC